MTGSGAARSGDRVRDAQVALAARVSLLFAVLAPLVAFYATAAAWTPMGGAAVAVGSAALVVAVRASLAPVVLQALALNGAPGVALSRERNSTFQAIRRPEEPGRPGRARPRAPGGGLRPRLAR